MCLHQYHISSRFRLLRSFSDRSSCRSQNGDAAGAQCPRNRKRCAIKMFVWQYVYDVSGGTGTRNPGFEYILSAPAPWRNGLKAIWTWFFYIFCQTLDKFDDAGLWKTINYGKKLAKNWNKSHVQLAFNPFFGWFRVPVPPLLWVITRNARLPQRLKIIILENFFDIEWPKEFPKRLNLDFFCFKIKIALLMTFLLTAW